MKNKEQKINEFLKTAVMQNSPDVFDEVLKSFNNTTETHQNNNVIDINTKNKTSKKWLYIAASIVLVLFVSSYALTNGLFMSKKYSTNKSFAITPQTNGGKVTQSQSKNETVLQESAQDSVKGDSNFDDKTQTASSNSVKSNITASSPFSIDNLPTLNVSSNNISINAIRGGYCWYVINKDGTKGINDYKGAGPEELVKNSTPLILLPDSSFKLIFSYEPYQIDVKIYNDPNLKQLEVINGTIKTPTQKGILICTVFATWEQGTASYSFLIDVK